MGRHDDTSWKMSLYEAVGEAVRMQREKRGWSARFVAERMGLTYTAVNRVEEGTGVPLAFVVAFAQLCELPVQDFIPHVPAVFQRVREKEGV